MAGVPKKGEMRDAPVEISGSSESSPRNQFTSNTSGPPVCICCSDEAVAGRIVNLLPGGMAAADFDGIIEEVSVELIESAPGDIVLVHAKVAIARLSGKEGSKSGASE